MDLFGGPRARRGRPTRKRFENKRTILWSRSVRYAVNRRWMNFEEVLGDDGRWNGLWSRYSRGTASPMDDRIKRIDDRFPGTARYFYSPFWWLVENRMYSRDELDECVRWLHPVLQKHFMTFEQPVFGKRWATHSANSPLFTEALGLISDIKLGFDAVTALLIAVREAELIQDSMAYLRAIKAWAGIEPRRLDHPVLSYLSPYILLYVTRPLRRVRFAQPEVNDLLQNHLSEFCGRYSRRLTSMRFLDSLLELPV